MDERGHSYLLSRARRFRRIAREVSDKATSNNLHTIAEGFDAEAKTMELGEKIVPPSK
ncbi:hypothetical protein BV98_002696 [Sphingobium herbicidovorans NBRC 16415]|uniref:Uncharacterized protein n=1 Tax=Sphingobium herbicidovorans (strain ATCC 700291 / DSM 11019 / CCUG 56400 / KCTC 2939 / LMG 18315 / NBRC 16415 / MH) TaxID=1219045 RepID=A0A086P7Y2_SPHHM|nr:hypothetical protein BV98_002696 [Sphingobium herbicidovorans NBRC 16415]